MCDYIDKKVKSHGFTGIEKSADLYVPAGPHWLLGAWEARAWEHVWGPVWRQQGWLVSLKLPITPRSEFNVNTNPCLFPLHSVLENLLVAESGPAEAVAVYIDKLNLDMWPSMRASSVRECPDLAAKLWRGGVTPELDHGPRLAQAVGRLTAVISKVLLAHTGHSQGVSLGVPVMGDEVAPPAHVPLSHVTPCQLTWCPGPCCSWAKWCQAPALRAPHSPALPSGPPRPPPASAPPSHEASTARAGESGTQCGIL